MPQVLLYTFCGAAGPIRVLRAASRQRVLVWCYEAGPGPWRRALEVHLQHAVPWRPPSNLRRDCLYKRVSNQRRTETQSYHNEHVRDLFDVRRLGHDVIAVTRRYRKYVHTFRKHGIRSFDNLILGFDNLILGYYDVLDRTRRGAWRTSAPA